MNMNNELRIMNYESGFIALVSTIIVASLLLTITVALNLTGFFGRYNILDTEMKETSLSLAEACADTAILKMQTDPSYSPTTPEVILVGSDQCSILSVTGSWATNKVIQVQARYPQSGTSSAYTNLKITISEPAAEIIVNSWEEVPKF